MLSRPFNMETFSNYSDLFKIVEKKEKNFFQKFHFGHF
jgi:hypothetical protein